VGSELTAMLQALKHRGPDSTGFGLYGNSDEQHYVARVKFAEEADMKRDHDMRSRIEERRKATDAHLEKIGATVVASEPATEYAYRYQLKYDGDLRELADELESVDGTEILSIGHALELIKDLGASTPVSTQDLCEDAIGMGCVPGRTASYRDGGSGATGFKRRCLRRST
jgi:glutamate synthase domain-containing protein 1